MWQVKRTHLSWSIFESSIDEQHDGCFEMDLLLVDPSTSVKVIDQALSIIPIKICAHFHNTFFETNQAFFYQTTKFYQKPQSVCLSFVFLGKIFSHKGLKEWGGLCKTFSPEIWSSPQQTSGSEAWTPTPSCGPREPGKWLPEFPGLLFSSGYFRWQDFEQLCWCSLDEQVHELCLAVLNKKYMVMFYFSI